MGEWRSRLGSLAQVAWHGRDRALGSVTASSWEAGAPATGDTVVSVRGLTRCFGEFVAVDHVDLDVARGEVFGFLGPNGSGKTTFIRMLTGALAPSAGRAHVLGQNVVTHPERVAARIGYMSQRFSLFPDLTVAENLRFSAGVYGVPAALFADRCAALLDSTGLAGRERTLTAHLSVGLRQRLALGAATLHDPELLVLDEPTSGVDPVARRQFWDLLAEVSDRGVTLFVTTHYLQEASNCGRLAFMYRGRVVADGSPRDLRAQVADRTGRPDVTLDDAFVAFTD